MRIAVLGLGYVGLTTAVGLAEMGHETVGYDIDTIRTDRIAIGELPFYEPGLAELLQKNLNNYRFSISRNGYQAIQASEVIFICVGTPLVNNMIDVSMVEAAADTIGRALHGRGQYSVIVVKSTVIPGTSYNIVRGILSAHLDDTEFSVCMNPEFLREGRALQDFLNPDRIVIGESNARGGSVLHDVYKSFKCPIIHTTLENAEMVKYASNALLATLISFSNEIASLCEVIPKTDVQTVLDILHLDRRLLPQIDGQHLKLEIASYLWAGCGYGGSCLPKDTQALVSFGQSVDIAMPVLQGVIDINRQRPKVLVDMAMAKLGNLSGKVITILGIAFKPGTSDIRESPALFVIRDLLSHGAIVRAYDPLAELEFRDVTACENLHSALTDSDAAIICTAWHEFVVADWHSLSQVMKTPIIFDGRGILNPEHLPENVFYRRIGKKYNTFA